MACNSCETGFQSSQTLTVRIAKSGANALLYVRNQGKNIVLIRRIILCVQYADGGTTMMYLRPPPDAISWTPASTYLEPGSEGLYYTLQNVSAGRTVQAQAEYTEIDGRSRSCPETF